MLNKDYANNQLIPHIANHIKQTVKNSAVLSAIFVYGASFLLNILKCIVPMDRNLVLFVSYHGKTFRDSPRIIYDYMKTDPRCKNFKYVWAFADPKKYNIEDKMVKIFTLSYIITALRARIWITDISVSKGVSYKRKNTVCINTWHAIPSKKVGLDTLGKDVSKIVRTHYAPARDTDIMLAVGKFDSEIYSKAFDVKKENIPICGLPRHDELMRISSEDSGTIKARLGVPCDKKVVLYAPTFRDYHQKIEDTYIFDTAVNLKHWRDVLGDGYLVLLRCHPLVSVSTFQLSALEGFAIDVSSYEEINHLLVAADILISDYSSVFYDYSILGKPMIAFMPDLEEYTQKRGLYYDPQKEYNFPVAKDEEALLHAIKNSTESQSPATIEFCNRFIEQKGNAAQLAVEFLLDYCKGNTSREPAVREIITDNVITEATKARNSDTNYWNQYYKSNSAPDMPSDFATFVMQYVAQDHKLIDLGCGNGRDSVFFSRLGLNITAVDLSSTAIESINRRNMPILTIQGDFTSVLNSLPNDYDYCYARWSIHAITESQQEDLFPNVLNTLKKGGLFFIEARTINDYIYGRGEKVGVNEFIFNNHYRRFLDPNILKEQLIKLGFEIVFSAESDTFSVVNDPSLPHASLSSPTLIRIVARRK